MGSREGPGERERQTAGEREENKRMRSIEKMRGEGREKEATTREEVEVGTRVRRKGGRRGRRREEKDDEPMCNDIQIKYPPHCAAYGKPTSWKREREREEHLYTECPDGYV